MNFKKRLSFFGAILFISVFVFSCSSDDQNAAKTPLNPNGDSELAILMREMFDDAMEMKSQVEKGKVPKSKINFDEIHTAEGTEPEKVASEQYRIFADSYLAAMKSLEDGSDASGQDPFLGMVESCMNCHKAMCPGPIVKIERLYPAN